MAKVSKDQQSTNKIRVAAAEMRLPSHASQAPADDAGSESNLAAHSASDDTLDARQSAEGSEHEIRKLPPNTSTNN